MLVDFIVGACLNKESLCLKASLNASSLQMAGWDGEGSATRCPGGRGGGVGRVVALSSGPPIS